MNTASGTPQLQVIRDAIDSITRHQSQRDILSALLDAAAEIYPRTALFVLKGGALAGWAGLGFLGEGGFRSDQIAGLTVPAAGSHVLARAVAVKATVRASAASVGEEVRRALGNVKPADTCASPLLIQGRVVAVLYGDSGASGGSGDPMAFEILARVAALTMERSAGTNARGRGASAPARSAAPGSGAVTPPEDAEMQAILADLGGTPRPSGGDGLDEEQRRRLADARRFAQLLVSELLLYNEAAVIQGRKNRDLAARLRKEIDRSRQAFRARFPTLGGGANDFFGQEVLRTLAQGDPALLGP